MTVAEDVTKEMVLDVIEWALSDMAKEQEAAQKEYENNRADKCSLGMSMAYQFAGEMIRNRIDTLQD